MDEALSALTCDIPLEPKSLCTVVEGRGSLWKQLDGLVKLFQGQLQIASFSCCDSLGLQMSGLPQQLRIKAAFCHQREKQSGKRELVLATNNLESQLVARCQCYSRDDGSQATPETSALEEAVVTAKPSPTRLTVTCLLKDGLPFSVKEAIVKH